MKINKDTKKIGPYSVWPDGRIVTSQFVHVGNIADYIGMKISDVIIKVGKKIKLEQAEARL